MSDETASVRDEVRAWLAAHWDTPTRRAKAGGSMTEWMDAVLAAG